MLFAKAGLSAGEISSLFVIWSVTAFTLEVPTGLWADMFSHRWLLTMAPGLAGAGYAPWTLAPSYPSFALGFILWGAAGALRSGTLQALVYEELSRTGATGGYARLIGRSQAIGTAAVMAATGLAAPVLAACGYRAVGIASIAATMVCAAVGWTFPDSRGRREPTMTYAAELRGGLAEARRMPQVRRSLVLVAVLTGMGALDEYIPLLAQSTGVAAPMVPLLVLLVTAGLTAGGWLGGRGTAGRPRCSPSAPGAWPQGRRPADPAGLLLVAIAFGIFQWAIAGADARLQGQITDRSRAAVTSIAGLGTKAVALVTFAAYALGST